MSRCYEISVEVERFVSDRESSIRAAVDAEWSVDDNWVGKDSITYRGNGYLHAGISEEEIARRIHNAVWAANGAYCEVRVRCVCLDDIPAETYTSHEKAYEEWKEKRGSASPDELEEDS